MAKNNSGLFKAALALSFALFVAAFVVIKSDAIETHVTTTEVAGKSTEKKSYRFNAGKIPVYLKSVVAPITGSKAISEIDK